ncbi:MAG: LicD family protein [Oscillospiraceae bacterium]|nr:LicD family protein [Oscillospiraceae bacterium]
MLPIKIELPPNFLDEEIRDGYVVTSQMKKVWAVQLDLLSELQRVCKKYGLSYYADSGTLLGAVRHGGYIPWDDDIDVSMMREDYEKLKKVAVKEFSDPYLLQNAETDHFYKGFCRLRNTRTTAIIKNDIGKSYCKGIFLDLFVMDNLPDDEIERKKWVRNIKRHYRFLRTVIYQQNVNSFWKRMLITTIGTFYRSDEKQLAAYYRYEKLCRKYNGIPTKQICFIAHARGRANRYWDAASYSSTELVPFEFLTIAIPTGYDARLRTQYGEDYMTPRKAPNGHGETVFDPETPFTQYFVDEDNHEATT